MDLRSSLYVDDNDTIISGVTEVTGAGVTTRGFRSSRYWGGGGGIDTIAEEECYDNVDANNHDQPPVPVEPIGTNFSPSCNDEYYYSNNSSLSNKKNNNNLTSSMTSSHYWLQRQRGEHDDTSVTNNSSIGIGAMSTHSHSVHRASSLPTTTGGGNETLEEEDEVVGVAYGNTRLPTHSPKNNSSTQELNVVHFQDTDDIIDADEVTPIPNEYLCDEYGNRYHPKKNDVETQSLIPMTTSRRASLEMIYNDEYNDEYISSPLLFSQKRKWYTITTILAAIILALLGLSLSITSLKSSSREYGDLDPINNSNYSPYNNYNYGGGGGGAGGGYYTNNGNVYLPGGQSGGIIGGQLRRQQSLLYGSSSYSAPPPLNGMDKIQLHNTGGTYTINHDSKVDQNKYAPLSSSSSSGGGVGFGAEKNDDNVGNRIRDNWSTMSGGSTEQQQVITSNVLTTTPLTAYTPPQDGPHDPNSVDTTLLPSNIEAYVELSILPYNPIIDIPTILHVPYGIKALDQDMDIIKSVLGTCYKLVQCSNEGSEILSREYEQEQQEQQQLSSGGGGERQEDGERRYLMELVPNDNTHLRSSLHQEEEEETTNNQVVAVLEEEEESSSSYSIPPPSFNPPIRTEMVDTSTYVNVDCTYHPHGIDRAISQELLRSGMMDVIHSSNLTDTSRLFISSIRNQDATKDKQEGSGGATYHHGGRPVVIIRNPLDRSIAKYEWMRVMNDNVQKMTLEQFVMSGKFCFLTTGMEVCCFCMISHTLTFYPIPISIYLSIYHPHDQKQNQNRLSRE